jgi:hypothetical protein
VIFALLAFFVLGFLAHQQGWHTALLRWGQAPGATFATWRARRALPTLAIDMRFADYQLLVSLRDRALRQGAHVPVEDEAVSARANLGAGGGETVDVRLPGGPASWLQGDTWPLELRWAGTTDWVRLVPVDETWTEMAWWQWGYLEALRREGFLTATQQFGRLRLNGRDWGLYLLETPAVAEPVLAFDPQNAWEARASGALLFEEGFRRATVTVVGDARSSDAIAAVEQLRAVQAGEISLSERSDAEVVGRFLALTALWTGQSAPDWRSLRWTYDPTTQCLIPVGGGQPWPEPAPLPEAFLNDPAVQVAYARALVEFSSPAYLSQLREEWGEALEHQWQVLGGGTSVTPWTLLERRQQTLRSWLASDQGLSAAIGRRENGTFVLRLVNLQSFPLLILGLDAGGESMRPVDPTWVFPEDSTRVVASGEALVLRSPQGALPQAVRLQLPWDLTTAGGDTLFVVYRVWGTAAPEVRTPVTEPLTAGETAP